MGTMARIIDGTGAAAELMAAAAAGAADLRLRYGRPPGLAIVVAGDDPRAVLWAGEEERAAVAAGFHAELHRMPVLSSLQAVLQMIGRLNDAPEIDGVAVQLPLPEELDAADVLGAIAPAKDVLGLTPVQTGRLLLGEKGLRPCLPAAVMEILRLAEAGPEGRETVVIGHGGAAERQLAMLLVEAQARVTLIRAGAENLAAAARSADLLISLADRPGFMDSRHIRPGAVVIDAGGGQVDGQFCGDVKPDEALASAGSLAPVATGVVPLTLAMLMRNAVEATRWRFSASGMSPAS